LFVAAEELAELGIAIQLPIHPLIGIAGEVVADVDLSQIAGLNGVGERAAIDAQINHITSFVVLLQVQSGDLSRGSARVNCAEVF